MAKNFLKNSGCRKEVQQLLFFFLSWAVLLLPFSVRAQKPWRDESSIMNLVDSRWTRLESRMIPVCAMMGQAAGIAAAWSARSEHPVAQVDVAALQKELRAKGAEL